MKNKQPLLVCLTCAAILAVGLLSAPAASSKNKKVGLGPSFKGPIGLQLYSLRADFAKDVPSTLDLVRDFGFKYVELAGTYGLPPEQFRAMLKERGLVPIASHFSYEQLMKDPESVAKEAKALGLKYAGCAWIPREGDFTEEKCREAIRVFNRAGEALAKKGIKFFYHNHGYEFQPYGQGTLFDLLVTETNPKTVAFEMDVFWVVHPGQDPVALLQKYGKRWELMHIKDMKKGTETGLLTGSSDVENDVVVGTGQIDIPAVLKEAKRVGVKYYFIEDESSAVKQQIPQTLNYLEQLKW